MEEGSEQVAHGKLLWHEGRNVACGQNTNYTVILAVFMHMVLLA